jgi:hypothetical protein
MPDGASVRPRKWADIEVLFDDGSYSVISGRYDGGNHSVLGMRWNGTEGELGYPNMAGNPVWHVVPEFLAIAILQALLSRLAGGIDDHSQEFSTRIRRELLTQYQIQIEEE